MFPKEYIGHVDCTLKDWEFVITDNGPILTGTVVHDFLDSSRAGQFIRSAPVQRVDVLHAVVHTRHTIYKLEC